jgi:hypothetical protein
MRACVREPVAAQRLSGFGRHVMGKGAFENPILHNTSLTEYPAAPSIYVENSYKPIRGMG